MSQQDAFAFLNGGTATYDSIYVQATPGTTEAALTASVQQRVGTRYIVRTGDDLRKEAAGEVADIANVLGTVLQVFAYVALFVGIFIIYNTFSIVVTQRVREFALLRAVGARGAQLGWAVVLEALVVGVVASVIGMLAGIGLFLLFGKAVPVVADLVGTGSIALHVHADRVIEVVIVGTIVTVVSAAIPAFRAARVRPMAAMRTAAVDRSGTNPFRAVLGLVAIGLGATLLLVGMATHNGTVSGLMIGAGPVLLFIGVLIGGPVLASGFATAAGWLLNRFGASSRLAAANSKRNPGRTASTANALDHRDVPRRVRDRGGWRPARLDRRPGRPAQRRRPLRVRPPPAGSRPICSIASSPRRASPRRRRSTTRSARSGSGRAASSGDFGDRVSAGDFTQVAKVLDAETEQGDLATLARRPGRLHQQRLRRRPAAVSCSFPSSAAPSRSPSRTA